MEYNGAGWFLGLTFGGEAANELLGLCSLPAELLERPSQSHDFRLVSICLIASRAWPLAVYRKALHSPVSKCDCGLPLHHEQCHPNGSAACGARRIPV